jgi:hypothetical protein
MAVDSPGEVRRDDSTRIRLSGIELDVPDLWEARISKGSQFSAGGDQYSIAHAATIPLPSNRGDYGSNVVERLGPHDIFVSLVEFGSEAANTELFPNVAELPREITAEEFHPKQLQRVIPGQAGKQVFFTYEGRAFCLYVVFGSVAQRRRLTTRLSGLLAGISVEPA